MEKSARTTKKQRELLAFIDAFIKGNNYGPSYREIMRALGYKSVSTVAVHVDGLIARGYLRKKDNSARSIEVVSLTVPKAAATHEEWLVGRMNDQLAVRPELRTAFAVTLEALNIDAAELHADNAGSNRRVTKA